MSKQQQRQQQPPVPANNSANSGVAADAEAKNNWNREKMKALARTLANNRRAIPPNQIDPYAWIDHRSVLEENFVADHVQHMVGTYHMKIVLKDERPLLRRQWAMLQPESRDIFPQWSDLPPDMRNVIRSMMTPLTRMILGMSCKSELFDRPPRPAIRDYGRLNECLTGGYLGILQLLLNITSFSEDKDSVKREEKRATGKPFADFQLITREGHVPVLNWLTHCHIIGVDMPEDPFDYGYHPFGTPLMPIVPDVVAASAGGHLRMVRWMRQRFIYGMASEIAASESLPDCSVVHLAFLRIYVASACLGAWRSDHAHVAQWIVKHYDWPSLRTAFLVQIERLCLKDEDFTLETLTRLVHFFGMPVLRSYPWIWMKHAHRLVRSYANSPNGIAAAEIVQWLLVNGLVPEKQIAMMTNPNQFYSMGFLA